MTGAQQLRDWMDRRRYNQAELAQELGVQEAYVSMLLNGKRTPSLELAVKIEEHAGIPAKAWSLTQRHNSKNTTRRARETAADNKL